MNPNHESEANVSDLRSELRRLIPPMFEAASLYWIQPEFNYLGGSPELCGYNCALCGGGGDTEETIEHASGCIVPDAMALPRILTALAAPAVKPFEWFVCGNSWYAITPFGNYNIDREGSRYRWSVCFDEMHDEHEGEAPTLEAAQDAAWAHWRERIGGAIQ